MATSPNDKNYSIPTGTGFFTPSIGTGAGARRSLGNIVNFTISSAVTTKEHTKNSGGKRTVDKKIITQVGATAKFALDEITAANLEYFALGLRQEQSDGSFIIKGLSQTRFEGFLEVIGDNDTGNQVDWSGDVSFIPSGDFSIIKDNDDWSTIAIEATVQADSDGDFGTWAIREEA
ncbi:hypothetical protein FFI89_018765 [Bradyrhizobium sp. KBS0727]|uniref:hypothetical protein n=1 Tax=unclassified Bradyrhizobium TaxID=2631580 RepID=UPI00110D2C81|nr:MULTISPECIES: hypothetical protein [unclassified Bradyrhizobium]QDW39008.1 hypothetical protein FFI71_018765 [Bradyrhizobium sp. KBS0725]QDW45611.1 hypothetical protein FFI89_018765 [Bradyrhizobium sp. KBS0727]